MSWLQFWLIVGANFLSVLLAIGLISGLSAWKEYKRKKVFMDQIFGQVLAKAETDIQFRNIMGWNFMRDERDKNDEE